MPASANWIRAMAPWFRLANKTCQQVQVAWSESEDLRGREVEMRELYVELSKPRGISEPTTCDPCFDRLRNLQIQPVEPFQAVCVDTNGADGLKSLDNVRDRLRSGLDSCQQRSVVRKHAPF